jgi:ribose/xylose/arabinose/galactoside ABC-type transport system permease subunit
MHDERLKKEGDAMKATGRAFDFRILQRWFLLGSLVAVLVIFSILDPRFMSVGNIINISRQMSINMIIAVGMTFCMISGGFDLSVGSIGAMCGCITGLMMAATGEIILSMMAGLAAGALTGLVNGLVIAKLRVNPFVATLGTMTTTRGIAMAMTGGLIISDLPHAFNYIGIGFIYGIPLPVIYMIIIVIIGYIVLSRTEFGLNTYAIGGNVKAARLAGLKNDAMIIKIYTLSGFLSALAGIILTARVVSAQPGLMMTTNLDVIAALVVGGISLAGGVGSMGNTILGSILMATLFNGLNIIGVGYEWQLILVGGIIIFAVALDMVSRKKDI